MPRSAPRIVLAPSQRLELEQLLRSPHTPQGVAKRARIILAAAKGFSNKKIAQGLRITEVTVGKWRRGFCDWGVQGLKSLKPLGRPRKSAHAEEELKYWVCRQPTDKKKRWTIRALAHQLGLPPSTLHDMLGRVRLPRSRYLPWRRVRA